MGLFFKVAEYDENNHIKPLMFFYSIRTWSAETWINIFEILKELNGSDIDDRKITVNKEISTYKAFRETLKS